MRARIVAIVIALVVALVGAVAVIGYAHRADKRAVAGQKVQTVYIAAKAVPTGTTAKSAADQGLITLQQVVAKGVPDGALTELPGNAGDVVALDAIPPGEIVLASRFGARSEVQTHTGVPAGMVAIAVGLSQPAAVKGFIRKGAHVAIYDTFNARNNAGRPRPAGAQLTNDKTSVRATRVVLPNVEVLDVVKSGGSSTTAQAPSSPTGGPLLVTVAVKPADAPRLVHAIQTGTLYAVLLGQGASIAAGSTATDNTVVGR